MDLTSGICSMIALLKAEAHLMILCWLYCACWGLAAGYKPRPQVVDRGTTARYGGQLRYI